MKKTLSFILALVMIMAIAVPAFAADPVSGGTITSTSTVEVPTIDIGLPTATTITLNPYGLAVSGGTTAQVQNAAMFLENKSDVAVKVNLAVTGELPTENADKVAFATASTAGGKATTKSIFLYVDVQENADGSTAATIGEYNSKNPNQIVVAAKEAKKDVVVLDKTGGAKAYAQIMIGGDMVAAPTTAWTAKDAVKVKMVFDCTATVKAAS